MCQVLRDIFSVHEKFSTSLAQPRNQTVFHFRANHSQLEMVLRSRVFSKESFCITFSTTGDQDDDEHLAFSFQQDRTTLTGNQSKVWEEKSIFEFGKLNDFEIEFKNKSIIFINKKASASIAIDGNFDKFKFIGFYSVKPSSWIVPQSKIVKC